MLLKYHFKIKYINRKDNKRADTLSRRAELQGNKKPLRVILRLDKDRKVRYNYPQLAGTYKAQEMQLKATYILKNIAEKFIKEFYKGETQGYNRATALVLRLQEEYIIRNVWNLTRKIIKECLDC